MKKMRVFGSWWTKLVVVGLVLGLVAACKDKNRVKPMTIADVIANDGEFSILAAAIRHADLDEALRSGPLTLLAPNDAAFRASGFADAAAVTSRPSAEIRDLLKYHVLTSAQSQAEIATANGKTIPNLAEKPAYVTVDGAGAVLINGVRIIQADRKADNGTIHVVERVLQPISRNLLEELKRYPDLNFAVAAAERAASGSNELIRIFTSPTSQYTFFAPNNQAFIDLGFPSPGSTSAANPAFLAEILLYNIVPGRVLANNFVSGNLVTAATGNKSIRVEVGNGIRIIGNGNGGRAAVVGRTNILATNGVIHATDRVLRP